MKPKDATKALAIGLAIYYIGFNVTRDLTPFVNKANMLWLRRKIL